MCLTWMGNFKILSYAINRGPLCQPFTVLQFALAYVLPVTPRKPGGAARLSHSAGTSSELALRCLGKVAMLYSSLYAAKYYTFPTYIEHAKRSISLSLMMGLYMDAPGAIAGWVSGLEISPHFDNPCFSTSFQNFWSHRWDLTVGNCHRILVYDPIVEGRLISTNAPYKRNNFRRAVAVCSAFLVSGIMHELLLWIFDPTAATGHWLAFFAVQGPIVVAEVAIKYYTRIYGIRLPVWASIPLTISLQLFIADQFWYPPINSSGLTKRFVQSLESNPLGTARSG